MTNYKVKILEGKDPKAKPKRKEVTVGLLNKESGDVLETMGVGLNKKQLESTNLEKRLARYGERLKASYENSSNLDEKYKENEVSL